MTPEQKIALEGLIGRSLTAPEETALEPLLAIRNDVAITALLSAGRVQLVSKMITARGIQAAMPVTDSAPFLRLLKTLSKVDTAPTWLAVVLTAMNVPADKHPDYFETLASAHGWLVQEAGLDIGSAALRNMLDLIAAGNPGLLNAVTIIKALGSQPNPLDINIVSRVLNIAEGRMVL